MFVVIRNLILLSKHDTTDLLTTEINMNFSVSNSFSDFTTRVVNDYEANIDNNVRHAQETTMFGAMPFSIAAAMGYGHFAGRIGGTITTAFEAVEDVVTGHDVNAKDGDR